MSNMTCMLLMVLCMAYAYGKPTVSPSQTTTASSDGLTTEAGCQVYLTDNINSCLYKFEQNYELHKQDDLADDVRHQLLPKLCFSYRWSLQCLHYKFLECTPNKSHLRLLAQRLGHVRDYMEVMCYVPPEGQPPKPTENTRKQSPDIMTVTRNTKSKPVATATQSAIKTTSTVTTRAPPSEQKLALPTTTAMDKTVHEPINSRQGPAYIVVEVGNEPRDDPAILQLGQRKKQTYPEKDNRDNNTKKNYNKSPARQSLDNAEVNCKNLHGSSKFRCLQNIYAGNAAAGRHQSLPIWIYFIAMALSLNYLAIHR